MKEQTLERRERMSGLLGLRTGDEELISKVEKLAATPTLSRVVKRLVSVEKVTEQEALEMKDEFLRFISLVHVSNQPIAPTAKADTFWHEFIIYTKEYTAFCQDNFGTYIHHSPVDDDSPVGPPMTEYAKHTQSLLKLYFGIEPLAADRCNYKCSGGGRICLRPK